jgi:hypothetical protein
MHFYKFEPRHDKTNIMGLRPVWIQTSLRIRAVFLHNTNLKQSLKQTVIHLANKIRHMFLFYIQTAYFSFHHTCIYLFIKLAKYDYISELIIKRKNCIFYCWFKENTTFNINFLNITRLFINIFCKRINGFL